MTFEIIQSNGEKLRFGDEYFWEYHTEECSSSPDSIKEDRTIVRVFRNQNDFVDLITTIFRPIRVDSVADDTTLQSMFRLRVQNKCPKCNWIEP